MIAQILKFLLKPTISYGVTVCNEAKEIELLLNTLITLIDEEDEIIVLQDVTNRNEEVIEVLKRFENKIFIIESKLNGDFATFKNNLIPKATKKYLFQIDADEIPKESLIKKLKFFLAEKFYYDIFQVPRINLVEGITKEHLQKWNWKIDEKGCINFPDYQQRIFKLNGKIKWKNKVHEVLFGSKKSKKLPCKDDSYCLIHPKKIERQERQNAYYDTF